MNKAQQMLAKAGFPDTAAGRAAFHKKYPTPESFFQVHGGQDTEMYGAGSTIHIDPSKRGTFTAAASKHGKSVQEFASQVLANKEDYSPAMVKKANFARNAASWKHEDGGPVMYAEGGKLPEGILRSRLEAHMSPDEAQNYINKYDAGSMVGNPPPYTEEEAIMDARSGKSRLERFPKKDPGFGNRGPGSYIYYMNRLKDRNVKTVNPHQGVKDAIIDTNTITGSCEAGNCYEFEDGGVVDAYQLMGMPTPSMYGEGSFTGNPYNRFGRRGRNTGDDHITGFATGFGNSYTLPQGYSSSGAYDPGNQNLVVNTNLTGVDYTKDFYNDNNISLGGGLSLGRAQQDRGSLFKTFNYTTPHGTSGTGYTHVAGPESKTFMTGDLHGNVDAHVPLFNPSWGAQRQGHRNIGAGNVEVVGLNASLEGGLSKFGSGKINPYYDASAGLGFLNNMMNINAGYTNRTGNSQVSLPSGTTSGEAQKGQPYVNMGAQVPLWIDNKGNTRFKVFGGWGTGPYDKGYAGATYTFANGGHVTDYSPSSNFGAVQSMNNTYMHGYANGGPVGMYGFGSTIKDLGYGLVDTQLSTIGSLTGIKSMQDIVDADQYSNDKFDNVANFAGKVGGTAVKFIPGVGQVVGAVGAGAGALANTAFKIDEKNYDPSKHTSNWDKVGNFVEGAGNIASSFVNPMGAADTLSKGAQTAMNVGKIAGLGATGINAARDIDKSRGGTYDPTNLLNLGMGVARSGFFGGNTNTTSNYTGNTKGAVDYTPTMDTPLYAAMGGAVNAPNMMKYDAGSNVPNQDNTSLKDQYNLLLKAKPVTKYFSPAMPFHPKDGSMDPRGTVVGSIDPQTGEPIEINIEKNEARWKLPNKTDFITTKKDTDKILTFDKNNDGIAKVTAMLNTTFDKNKKAAKESKMRQGGMVGQYGYGGGIMKYDGGSGIPPIDESMAGAFGYSNNYNSLGPIVGTGFYNPEAALNNEYIGLENINDDNFNFSSTMNPAVGSNLNPYGAAVPGDYSTPIDNYIQPSSLLTSQLTPNVSSSYMTRNSGDPMQIMSARNAQMLPVTNSEGQLMPIERVGLSSPMYDNPDRIPFRRDPGETWGMQQPPVYNPNNITSRLLNTTTNLNTGYGENQGKYPNQIPYKVEKGENWGSATKYNNSNDSSWFSRNKQDLGTLGGKAIMYGPGIYNVARSFGKPFQMNADNYKVKSDINPYEEEYVPDYRPYNAAVANLNRMPGSGNLAARTNLFNAMQQQQDDARYKISLANAQRKMTADQLRLNRDTQNANIDMQVDQINEQNRAAKRNMLGQGLTDASQAYQFERFNKLSANALGNIMQHFTMLPDGTMIPKTGYNPAAYNALYNTNNTSNVFDPSLVSPNRYSGGIDFNYSKPSFRNK